MRIDSAVITGSFSVNGDTFNDLGSYSTTGSNTFVGNQSIVGAVSASAFTGSISYTHLTNVPTLVSGSEQIVSILSPLNSFTASNSTTNTFTSSTSARLNSIETISASNIARLTSLEIRTGSLATTGSNTFIGTQTITGSLFISANLIVQGTSSLENITASAVSIGTNIVNLNTANPAIRYAGLAIGDSGSVGSSGSFLYDSVQDEMIFVHRGANSTVTSSVVLMGPQTFDNVGNETYLTTNRLPKGAGNEHLIDSNISDTGTLVSVNSPTIFLSGSVGIGTTTPSQSLHVAGRIYSVTSGTDGGQILLANSGGGSTWYWAARTTGLNLGELTAADGRIFIANGGNVGIGTTNPNSTLQVSKGGVSFQVTDTNKTANNTFSVYGLSQTSWAIATGNSGSFSGGERIVLLDNGNIGIGISNPSTKLHILNSSVGGSYFGQLVVEQNGEAAINIKGVTYSSIYFGDAANPIEGAIVYDHSTNKLELRGSGNSADLTITSGGSIGIGTTSPNSILEIAATTPVFRIQASDASNFHGIEFRQGAGFDSFIKQHPNSGELRISNGRTSDWGGFTTFYTDTIERLRITPSGNFEIPWANNRVNIMSYDNDYRMGLLYQANARTFTLFSTGGDGGGTIAFNTRGSAATGGSTDYGLQRMSINRDGMVTMPFQPSLLAQPNSTGNYTVGAGSHCFGWNVSGSVRHNIGFTLSGSTVAGTNVAGGGSSGKITVPSAGRYLFQFSVRNEDGIGSDGQFNLWVNGTMRIRRHIELWNGKPYIHCDVTAVLNLSANDTLEFGVWYNGNVTGQFSGTNDTVNWLSIVKVA